MAQPPSCRVSSRSRATWASPSRWRACSAGRVKNPTPTLPPGRGGIHSASHPTVSLPLTREGDGSPRMHSTAGYARNFQVSRRGAIAASRSRFPAPERSSSTTTWVDVSAIRRPLDSFIASLALPHEMGSPGEGAGVMLPWIQPERLVLLPRSYVYPTIRPNRPALVAQTGLGVWPAGADGVVQGTSVMSKTRSSSGGLTTDCARRLYFQVAG